jgi:UDP-glucose 4-epimerase
MRIIITGGAGFIGSHVQDAYLAMGHEILVIDNLITGNRRYLNPKTRFCEMDIVDPGVRKVFEDFKPDLVNHHAAQMDVRKSVADPLYDSQVNVLGMVNLLEASRQAGAKKFIFSSTGGAIYGEQDYFPADEKHPTRPASPYGLSKLAGEEYLKLYERLYGIPYVILRYANVYGPRQNPHGEAGVVAIFCERLLKGETPIINGDGEQTRDYVFVGDVIEANCAALRSDLKGVYNIGTGVETSVNAIYAALAKLAGTDQVEHGPAKAGEQRRSVISPELAKQAFGWKPVVTVPEGLKKTFEWFRENFQIRN